MRADPSRQILKALVKSDLDDTRRAGAADGRQTAEPPSTQVCEILLAECASEPPVSGPGGGTSIRARPNCVRAARTARTSADLANGRKRLTRREL
jgi:hypothetical protein